MSSLPTLGYWDTRALGEPIRDLLHYAGVKFNDKRYVFGEGIEYKRGKQWLEDRDNLGLDFPNLPYYIDGNTTLTQSVAIIRHLGRKYGLVATDEHNLIRQDLTEQQIQDMRSAFIPIIADNIEKVNQKYISETLIPQLELLSNFLANNEWFAGKVTYVDFLVYELLDWIRLFTPQTVDKFPNLGQFLKRFESLPPIKAYHSSSAYQSWPIMGPLAKWGYHK